MHAETQKNWYKLKVSWLEFGINGIHPKIYTIRQTEKYLRALEEKIFYFEFQTKKQ